MCDVTSAVAVAMVSAVAAAAGTCRGDAGRPAVCTRRGGRAASRRDR